jgi:hypothetical protein
MHSCIKSRVRLLIQDVEIQLQVLQFIFRLNPKDADQKKSLMKSLGMPSLSSFLQIRSQSFLTVSINNERMQGSSLLS